MKSLDPIARKKCVERLHLRGFDEYGDSYVTLTQTITVRTEFKNDKGQQAPGQFVHEFFFIEHQGLHNRRQLNKQKSKMHRNTLLSWFSLIA